MAVAVYLVPLTAERKRKKWAMRWRDSTGQWCQESCRCGDKKTAETMRRMKFDELNGLTVAQTQDVPRMTWAEFVEADKQILLARQRSANTVLVTQRTLEAFRGICNPSSPIDVTKAMVENFVVERAKPRGNVGEQTAKQISPATINKDLRTLRAVFSRAVRREILEVNPFSRVDKLREPEKVKRILSDNELAKLLPELKRRDHAVYGAVLVALSTGLRIGELANLKWAEVDLASGDLHVVNRADWRTKSTRNRYEWLPEFVRDALGPLQGRPWQGYVFADREPGKWYFRAADVFDAAVKAAKIAHCTFHDLRETALTRMAEGGAGVWVLQSIAGHSTPNVTAKHYVGVGREAVRSVISRHGERLKVAVGA